MRSIVARLHALRRLGVKKVRTGISWADWYRPNAKQWFDRQMQALAEFDTTITLCFTPPSRGKAPNCTSPPVDLREFSYFAREVIDRYVLNQPNGTGPRVSPPAALA